MLGSVHTAPTVPPGATVEPLRRGDAKANRLTPDSIVIVINRGRQTLTRKWDGNDYDLHPFTHDGHSEDRPYLMQMPYGAALHFQFHCPIPGTRDPNSDTLAAESFLGILDTDASEFCAPMTVEECQRIGQAIEAIERTAADTTVVDVKGVTKKRIGAAMLGNAPRRPVTTTGEDADREADEIARAAMRAPEGVSEEIQSEAAEGEEVLATSGGRRRR